MQRELAKPYRFLFSVVRTYTNAPSSPRAVSPEEEVYGSGGGGVDVVTTIGEIERKRAISGLRRSFLYS